MSSERAQAAFEAARVLRLTNSDLAEYLGVSRRTIQRKIAAGYELDSHHFHKLARDVHPHDPALAGQLAYFGGTTLAALGLGGAPVAAPTAAVATALHLDAVVCAAAEALDLSPRAIRPAVAAAFARAQETGLPLEAIATAFAKGTRTAAKK